MASLEMNIKKNLDEIIDFAFSDATEESDPNLESYKWYKIQFVEKNLSSKLAYYTVNNYTITMLRSSVESEVQRTRTLIHELSHHVQHRKYGYDVQVHGKEFYEVYAQLLYAAIDLGKIKLEDLQELKHVSSDHNKVQKILENYVPKTINIDENPKKIRIYCFNSYDKKEILKQYKYSWNSQNKAWYKEVEAYNKNDELRKLYNVGFEDKDIEIEDANKFLSMRNDKRFNIAYYLIIYDKGTKACIHNDWTDIEEIKQKDPYIRVKKYASKTEAIEAMKKYEKEEDIYLTEFSDMKRIVALRKKGYKPKTFKKYKKRGY